MEDFDPFHKHHVQSSHGNFDMNIVAFNHINNVNANALGSG
jgi:hypothetical protein